MTTKERFPNINAELAWERYKEASDLRAQGFTIDQIMAVMKVKRAMVYHFLKKADEYRKTYPWLNGR